MSSVKAATDGDDYWPLTKLLARHHKLREEGESRKSAVLLTTGAMNPVHLGHVDMFFRARRCLEQDHDYCVLAGYISPSNEGYVRPKCEHFNQLYLESDVRLECVRRAVQESDWLACGGWEAAPEQGKGGSWPDYPVVVKALQSHLSTGPDGLRDFRLGGHKCTVFYVCGLDHFQKCYLSSGLHPHQGLPDASTIEPRAGVIAIPRDDAPPARSELKRLVIGVTELNSEITHLSSTKVRKLLAASKASGGSTAQEMEERRVAIVQVVGGPVADFLMMRDRGQQALVRVNAGSTAATEPNPDWWEVVVMEHPELADIIGSDDESEPEPEPELEPCQFLLEAPNREDDGVEDYLLRAGLAALGLATPVSFTLKQLERGRVVLGSRPALVHGSVRTVECALRRLGIAIPPPNDYPACLEHFLHRAVRRRRLCDVAASFDGAAASSAVFVKPADRRKQFTGFVADSVDSFRARGISVNRTDAVLCSPVVDWLAEYRCYVVRGAIRAVCHYSGDVGNMLLSMSVVEQAVANMSHSTSCPQGYALDWGVLSTGETALIEFNDGYGLGAYDGISADDYTDLVLARWRQLTQVGKGES